MAVTLLEGTDEPAASVPATTSSASNDIIGDIDAPYALIMGSFRSIGGIVADVTVREINVDQDTITQFPVETGTPISDHVFANPKQVEIACGFSDTKGGPGYVQAVYQAMLALKATREPFDIFTGKRGYQNMLFTDITVTTDEFSEYALLVTARFQEVIISNSTDLTGSGMTAANQADPASTSPEVSVGNQTLQPAPSASLYSDYEGSFTGAPTNSDAPL